MFYNRIGDIMRWQIKENKRSIYTTNMEGHKEDIELSGEQVSAIIAYEVKDGFLKINKELIYPMFRLQPNVTQASYKVKTDDICLNIPDEIFDQVVIDGILNLYSHTSNLILIHHFYPSTTLPIFYEDIEIKNISNNTIKLDWESYKKIDVRLGCEGYIYLERTTNSKNNIINPNETMNVVFAYQARFANKERLEEIDGLIKRRNRVLELFNECDITTDSEVLDTMFTFAKLRVGESIFNTRKGRIHSPGGTNYYAAIWCNDQSEYSTPWFGFTGDDILQEAAYNAMEWYLPYMNDEFLPIPSSIISEGHDYWNGAGDRGDAAMFLYGNSRYFLEMGILPNEKQFKMLEWCYKYIKYNINSEGVLRSNTDELENRITSGECNLGTNSIAYGGLCLFSILLSRMNKDDYSNSIKIFALELKDSIIKYFAKNIKGYQTYQYHKGLNEIRAWNCLPLYMGIDFNSSDTLKSINDKLWFNGSCRSTENEDIVWDRSCLYYIATLFRCGLIDDAWEKLLIYSKNRLLGERVPYAIEAYPEYNMRHLSAESGLFCRIITDGILDIKFKKNGFTINPKLKENKNIKITNLYCNGKYYSIDIRNGKVTIKDFEKVITDCIGHDILIN